MKSSFLLLLILAVSVSGVLGAGFEFPPFVVTIIIQAEESLAPWVDTVLFVLNFPLLWSICWVQANLIYQAYGTETIMTLCQEKSYDSYQTIWKAPPEDGTSEEEEFMEEDDTSSGDREGDSFLRQFPTASNDFDRDSNSW